MNLDDIDRKIINRIQSDLPINSSPFLIIGNELGISEDDVVNKIRRLKARGIIRRIGGNISPDKLGFVSTLCAARVPEDKIEYFADTVNSYSGVTHNYQRNGEFNVWFTFIAGSVQIIEKSIKDISQKTGIKDILNLPATKVFKIKAHFNLP